MDFESVEISQQQDIQGLNDKEAEQNKDKSTSKDFAVRHKVVKKTAAFGLMNTRRQQSSHVRSKGKGGLS